MPPAPLPADLLALSPNAIGAPVQLERELAELDEESRAAFADDLGITGSDREKTIRDIFYGMGRIVFFTVGDDECRAWAIDKGTPGRGSGRGHSHGSLEGLRSRQRDELRRFPRGRLRGEALQDHGTLRQESKEYIVQDGDIMHILANR